MKKIKKDILDISIELFKNKGIANVTMRNISDALDISVGNLTYHFPLKKDIIHELVLKMIDLPPNIRQNKSINSGNSLVDYHHVIKTMFTELIQFDFILKQLSTVVGDDVRNKLIFIQALNNRVTITKNLHAQFVKDKLVNKKILKYNDVFVNITHFIAFYWQQNFYIYGSEITDEEKVNKAVSLYFYCYFPFLTKKGIESLGPLLLPVS